MRIGGGTLITKNGPERADLVVEKGRISDVIPAAAAAAAAAADVDATNLWILPGGVDAHTHFGMPLGGGLSTLGWRESSEAALLGGTTTVIDFANPARGESLRAAVERWRGMADLHILCDYGLHCTVIETDGDHLAEIPALVKAGIPTFKGFLAYPGRLMLEPGRMRELMRAVADAHGLLLVHAEDGQMNAAAERVLADTGRIAPRWHPLAHPPESEIQAVRTALELARETGCALEIVHASLGRTAELVAAAGAADTDGAARICEVCLHHLFATDELYEAGHEAALAATCSPPLRARAEGEALLGHLAAGRIELLSTDHCEFTLKTKAAAAAGGFACVPNGCGGVGERLVVSYAKAVATGRLEAARWIDAVATRPAELMGLGARKGKLEPGYDADIVLFDPRPKSRWEPLGRSDRAGSLWAGMPVQGRVRDVWLRGRQVVQNGRLVSDQPGGLYLERRLG